jgi:hypothetical protein
VIPSTDVTSTSLRQEEMVIHLMNSLTEEAVWCIDPLLGKDLKTNEYNHCYAILK